MKSIYLLEYLLKRRNMFSFAPEILKSYQLIN